MRAEQHDLVRHIRITPGQLGHHVMCHPRLGNGVHAQAQRDRSGRALTPQPEAVLVREHQQRQRCGRLHDRRGAGLGQTTGLERDAQQGGDTHVRRDLDDGRVHQIGEHGGARGGGAGGPKRRRVSEPDVDNWQRVRAQAGRIPVGDRDQLAVLQDRR